MKELKKKIDELLQQVSGSEQIIKEAKQEDYVFPFSLIGTEIAYLLSTNKMSYDEYLQLNKDYSKRNKYLYLFEMAPRTFGETWGENHIRELFPQFIKATKENMSEIYPKYDGEFDLMLDKKIRVEVKACRANDTESKGSLVSRAYLHSEAIKADFKYHYQQLKPSCCDIFIWIGACRDELMYWILTSKELKQTGKLGPQHRNENTGKNNANVFEGQVFMTEEELKPFLVEQQDILKVVREKAGI